MERADRLQAERQEQKRWRALKPEQADPVVEKLLQGEYREPDKARQLEAAHLAWALKFAREQVPFYREDERWRAASFDTSQSGQEMLAQLPVLSKYQVQESFAALKAEHTPKGHAGKLITSSSGTTGRPTRVLFCRPAFQAFGFFVQRQLRWFRLDPSWTQGVIRLPRDIPRQADGERLADGATHRARGWMYVDKWFHTGPMVAFNRSNSVEAQIEWLQRERPEYLLTFPGTLETLVYASQGKPITQLQAARTLSATLTESMRQRIESATGLHVQQGYGLNEIGVVAGRCEAGRYHVNAEHCVVEIADDDGRACTPGEVGRILITALTNPAMPLIRYDSGDLAVAVEGPCSCGRTLPSFGRVIGRYRAMRYAPEGTSQRVNLVSSTIDHLPLKVLAGLREYQLHQNRDGSFDLRLVSIGEPDAQLLHALRSAWNALDDDSSVLRIHTVDSIPTAPGGKQQEFSSDFFPSVNEGSKPNSAAD